MKLNEKLYMVAETKEANTKEIYSLTWDVFITQRIKRVV